MMKTYLNRKGKYVSEQPVDGYFLSEDSHGNNVYFGDKFVYKFQQQYFTETADGHNTYWIKRGIKK